MRRSTLCLAALVLLFTRSMEVYAGEDDAGVNRHRQVGTHASRYGIHDAKLRETMLQLNTLVSFSEQPQAPLSQDNKEFLEELVSTVSTVVDSAVFLKKQDKVEHLGKEQLGMYKQLAEKLYVEAVSIEVNARKMKLEEMNQAFIDLNQTCIRCHGMFRDL